MTRREKIVALAAQGVPKTIIARRLGISREVVYYHLRAAATAPVSRLKTQRTIRKIHTAITRLNQLVEELTEETEAVG